MRARVVSSFKEFQITKSIQEKLEALTKYLYHERLDEISITRNQFLFTFFFERFGSLVYVNNDDCQYLFVLPWGEIGIKILRDIATFLDNSSGLSNIIVLTDRKDADSESLERLKALYDFLLVFKPEKVKIEEICISGIQNLVRHYSEG